MDGPHILFDHGPKGPDTLFRSPVRQIVARNISDVDQAFQDMEAAVAEGYWLAGYGSYELGYAFEPKLQPLIPGERRVPLLHFGVFGPPEVVQSGDMVDAAAVPTGFAPKWGLARYRKSFDPIMEQIRAGGYYQVNLTMPVAMDYEGDAWPLYQNLRTRQPVPHGAFVDLGEGVTLLSRSPELFFEIGADGWIETLPMKGTAPRSEDPVRDLALKTDLARDEKNMAENLMIVDLLRNDISRIAEVGSVKVPDLFRVDTYETVHQMVSRIQGQLRPEVTLTDIFHGLFPCGSITGAPKIAAMEAIAKAEDTARDVYCGAIGWIAPDGAAKFNVAIRTLAMYENGDVILNVGGGIVADSEVEAEYEEALWKARFATSLI